MMSNISVPLLGAVDTAVVGHLPGPHYIGAVAIGALIFSFVYWGFGFLRMGTTGFTAQAQGAGNVDEVRATLARALMLATALGLILIAVQVPIAWGALAMIDAGNRVDSLAETYFHIRIWGAPAALANYALLGWFIGIHNTRAALILQIAMNGINIVLDLWFVMGLGLGVAGVAWATLIAETGAVILGLWLVSRKLPAIGGTWRKSLIFQADLLRRMFAVNRDIFIRTLCLISAFGLVTAIGARMGEVILAANAVLLNFQSITGHALDGFAHAAEALTGDAIGARNRENFRKAVRATSLWALVFSAAFSAAYLILGTLVIDTITDMPEVRAVSRDFLTWVVILPVVSVWSYQLDGIFIGATRSADMRNAMMVSLAVFAGLLVLLVPEFGNHGLWLAFMGFMVARALTLGRVYPKIEKSIGEN
ncbi:MAG: MATE family efflux transporter [Rhodospirillales bacterium]|nr:MATE family efflux transporter [Rhodospirillales bacterium]